MDSAQPAQIRDISIIDRPHLTSHSDSNTNLSASSLLSELFRLHCVAMKQCLLTLVERLR